MKNNTLLLANLITRNVLEMKIKYRNVFVKFSEDTVKHTQNCLKCSEKGFF